MKRIVASRNYEDDNAGLSVDLANLRHDMKAVASVQTEADLANIEEYYFRTKHIIEHDMRKGLSLDESLERTLSFIMKTIQDTKDKMKQNNESKIIADQAIQNIKDMIQSMYGDVIEVNPYLIYTMPDPTADHDDCIRFTDDVISACGGRYYATGRGGSWTQWSIRVPGNVELSVGWSDSFTRRQGVPQGAWIVEVK